MSRRMKLGIGIGIAVALFGLGLLGGWALKTSTVPAAFKTVRNPQNKYPLIDPVLYTETPENLSYPKYTPLKDALAAYTQSAQSAGKATEISVYYRDLDSSDWVGINENDQFNPASMLKVVTLLALLNAAEVNPSLLDAKINVPASVALPASDQDYFPPQNLVQSGKTYTVPELMDQLITQSDNGANAILIQFLGDGALSSIFDVLNVPLPGSTNAVTAQQYSHLFRVLYNGSYLSPADSEKALELLTRTSFTLGLVAGVPNGTIVAHKFGETTTVATTTDSTNIHGLHDCGIVYYPDHPYFLCVMTRGNDFNTLASVIKEVSATTWQQVAAINK